jgi:hypothetical protein
VTFTYVSIIARNVLGGLPGGRLLAAPVLPPHASEPTGWMSPVRPRRFRERRSDRMNKAMRAARLCLAWNPMKVEPCPAGVADAITEWAEAVVGGEPGWKQPPRHRPLPRCRSPGVPGDEIRRQETFKLPIDGARNRTRMKAKESVLATERKLPSGGIAASRKRA